jgi:hypothetical protein
MIYATGTNWDYLVAKRIYDLYNSDVSGLMIYDANKPRPCYFVLWIEWVYGVAYRRACGALGTRDGGRACGFDIGVIESWTQVISYQLSGMEVQS